VHVSDGLGNEHKGENDGEDLAATLDDLSIDGTKMLDEHEHEDAASVSKHGEHGGPGDNLGVLGSVSNGSPELSALEERKSSPDAAKERCVHHDFRLRALELLEEVALLVVGGDSIAKHSEGDEYNANKVEFGRSLGVTKHKESNSSDQNHRGEVLSTGETLALEKDTNNHNRDDLGALEEHANGVVKVGETPVGEEDSTKCEDTEFGIVLKRSAAFGVTGDNALNEAAKSEGQRGQKRHEAVLSAFNQEDTLLKVGKEERKGKVTKGQRKELGLRAHKTEVYPKDGHLGGGFSLALHL